MRIVGKICGWVAATMLILQAICVFYGYPFHGVAAGIELIMLAVWCATDAIIYFKKPKHTETDVYIHYSNGMKEHVHGGKGQTTQSVPKYDCGIDCINVFTQEVEDE